MSTYEEDSRRRREEQQREEERRRNEASYQKQVDGSRERAEQRAGNSSGWGTYGSYRG